MQIMENTMVFNYRRRKISDSSGILFFITAFLPILLSIMLIFPSPVAATSITLNPDSGKMGAKIIITGDGFIGKVATIYWDDKKLVQNVPISKSGEINHKFDVPSAAKGVHIVKVTDDSNWSNITATSNFSVRPSITCEPPWGKINTRIYIFGYGFAPNESDIKFTWDGTPLSKVPIQADKTGSWSSQFEVPSAPKGEYVISAVSSSTGPGEVPDVVFTISPYCKLTPSSGPVGTKVTITGVGFRAGEDGLTFTWDGPILDTNVVAQPNGTFSYVITVPSSVKGRHIVGIYGSSFTPIGIVPDLEFEVTPGIRLTPSTVIGSRELRIDGSGFNADEIIAIKYDRSATDATATTDALGNFTLTMKVPSKPGKTHTVEAAGNKGGLAQADYTTGSLPPPSLQLLTPGPGATFYNYNSVIDAITGLFRSPGSLLGIGPASQPGGDVSLAVLGWSAKSDNTGMKYSLQISRSPDFASTALQKDDIASTSFNLQRSMLPNTGIYYWRVRAINDAGDVGQWSNSWQFESRSASPLVIAIAFTVIALIIAIIIFGIIALVSRNRYS
jgi:hypothetical protein